MNKRLEKKKETIKRHSKMTIKVYEIKLTHLSKEKVEYLNRLFVEAKWFYNDVIASNNIFNYNYKSLLVIVKNPISKLFECRHLFHLTAQMRQAILDKIKYSIKMLSSKKKKGRDKEVGKLKFKSEINSIPLKQYDMTYKIIGKNKIQLQCSPFKNGFRCVGLKQIPKEVEMCNATLIRKATGFFLKITCYVLKEKKVKENKVIGFDLGLRTTVTDSNGKEYRWLFEETEKLKYYQRKMQSQKYHSKNWWKSYKQFKKEWERIKNKKEDISNKFVSKVKNYKLVAFQNDNIHAWAKSRMKGWGKKIQHSIIGRIKSKLNDLETSYKVDRWIATTKLCPCCNTKNEIKLQDDENLYYSCKCGYLEKRDIHSAKNILNIALKATGMDDACGALILREAKALWGLE